MSSGKRVNSPSIVLVDVRRGIPCAVTRTRQLALPLNIMVTSVCHRGGHGRPAAASSVGGSGRPPVGTGSDEARVDIGRPGERKQRSEEHTSELQSRENLVCRLLLEKKK